MIEFQPSPAFVSFFNAIILAAESTPVAGRFQPTIPDFPDSREQAFAHTVLATLISQIDDAYIRVGTSIGMGDSARYESYVPPPGTDPAVPPPPPVATPPGSVGSVTFDQSYDAMYQETLRQLQAQQVAQAQAEYIAAQAAAAAAYQAAMMAQAQAEAAFTSGGA
jgi:hypothetical protein